VKPPSTSSEVAIAVAVGPAEVEIDRLRDLADSISHHDPGPATLVLIDDAPQTRQLDKLLSVPPTLNVVSLHHPRHGAKTAFTKAKGICSAILLAFQWIDRNLDAEFVLKLDTDSLVISPFRERLTALFKAQPELGMVGAYRYTPNGTERSWLNHAGNVRELARGFEWRHPIVSLRRDRAHRHIASLIRCACANGYTLAEHCMGGGYAVSRELLKRMAAAQYLDDPSLWISIDLPEDVMIGIHVRAVGLEFADSVREGEVFGVRYQGLPDSPENLLAKRYAVIHAVKNDESYDEASVRAFFRADRERGSRQA
jgi:hypothetical protein